MLVRTGLLTIVGVALVAGAARDVGLPGRCDRADALATDQRLAEARTEYVRVLQQEPSAECGVTGLKRTVNAQCASARRLDNAGRKEEATKAYLAIAHSDPVPRGVHCAYVGLKIRGPSCETADRLAADGLLTAAHAAYTELAGESRTRVCAAVGLDEVREKRCAAARLLEADEQDDAAKKAFAAIATSEPPGPMRRCIEG